MSHSTPAQTSATLGALAHLVVTPSPAIAPETSTGPGRCALQGDTPRHRKPPPSFRDHLHRIWHWSEHWHAYRHDGRHGTEFQDAVDLLAGDLTGLRPLKLLTVQQPWASAIAAAAANPKGKTIENREWATQYRGVVGIHAGRVTDRAGAATTHVRELLNAVGWAKPTALPHGAVIALATIVGCHRPSALLHPHCCQPWGQRGCWHWELSGIAVLAEPVPCRGFVGLFDAPAAVREAIIQQRGVTR